MKIFNKISVLSREINIWWGWDSEWTESWNKTYSEELKDFGDAAKDFWWSVIDLTKATYGKWKEILTDEEEKQRILDEIAKYIPNEKERKEYYEKMKELSKEQLAEVLIYFEEEIKPELSNLREQIRDSVVERWTQAHKDHFNMKDMFDFSRQDERADKLVKWIDSAKDRASEATERQKQKIWNMIEKLKNKLDQIKQEQLEKEWSPEISVNEIKIRTQIALLKVAWDYEV